MISALRSSGVSVAEHHVPVWEDRAHNWQAGLGAATRVGAAQLRLLRAPRADFDAVIVGYPGHLDLAAARRVAGDKPVVFNPLVSLWDTFVDDRRRFRAGSLAARALAAIDRRALRTADLVVADTAAHADFFRRAAALPRDRVDVCFVGAEDRLFRPPWRPVQPFTALFVGKLIPLHGVETVLAAARIAADVRFKVIGSGQLEPLLPQAPPNVERIAWLPYEELPGELAAAGCALGIFGTSGKARRVIPNKVFQALAVGAPVVSADTPAARELLSNGRDALLVRPGDAEGIAAAVRSLAADERRARELAAAGRATYEAAASEEVLGRRWRVLLERLLR